MNRKGKLERQKAYHEAGHAVVARTLGITISYVTMLPTDDMTAGPRPDGQCELAYPRCGSSDATGRDREGHEGLARRPACAGLRNAKTDKLRGAASPGSSLFLPFLEPKARS
jgi:hypothetical protein